MPKGALGHDDLEGRVTRAEDAESLREHREVSHNLQFLADNPQG